MEGGAIMTIKLQSELTDSVVYYLNILAPDLPSPEYEVRFDSIRRWRFDLAWVDKKLAIECHGGTYAQGRHTRGDGFYKDRCKMNTAVVQGWRVLEYTSDHFGNPQAMVDEIRLAYERKTE